MPSNTLISENSRIPNSIENHSLPSLPFPKNTNERFLKNVVSEYYEKGKDEREKLNLKERYIVKNTTPASYLNQDDSESRSFKETCGGSTYLNETGEDYYSEEHCSVYLPKLEPREVEFLKLISRDDVNGVTRFLSENRDLNINCTNFQGISALHIALNNNSEAMVNYLLNQPGIEIGDTVLHAIRDNNIPILKLLLDAQKRFCPGLEFAGATHSTDFPEHVTPLILAAQSGHYEAVALLVSRGHTIARPHLPNCPCKDCKYCLAKDDPLHASSARLSAYQAISSPAYIVHVASDPILAAFLLTRELEANAAAYRQLAPAYLLLKDDVSSFAVDLLGCCRTSQEVEILLKQTSGQQGRQNFVLPRLLMAVDYKQKEFVAHPNTQQVLETYWLGDWYAWRKRTIMMKIATVMTRVFVTPAILFMCTVMPGHALVRHWQIPLNKLITHAAAYFVFLTTIFFISNQDKTLQNGGPPNTGTEGFLVLYVIGYMWSAFRMCLMKGPSRYFSQMWNWPQIVMLTLFGVTFALWYLAASKGNDKSFVHKERKYWDQYDPTLLAECTFCLATICAFFRVMFLCQLNYHLGPLQVSLGKMTIDIYKYVIVFAIIISAFASGLARFYQYYKGMVYEDEYGLKTVQVSSFTSLSDTLNTLFWALFCMAPLESADVVIDNVRDHQKTPFNKHRFTERIGYLCFGCFEVISVIVVLNMLIATMSNTFQRVNDNVAIEWTFGRTEVYVDYMTQTMLPPPYNLIPTATGMMQFYECLKNKLAASRHGCYTDSSPHAGCVKRSEAMSDYPLLMSVLVQRYFRDKEFTLNADGDADLLKREINALKTTINKHFHNKGSVTRVKK